MLPCPPLRCFFPDHVQRGVNLQEHGFGPVVQLERRANGEFGHEIRVETPQRGYLVGSNGLLRRKRSTGRNLRELLHQFAFWQTCPEHEFLSRFLILQNADGSFFLDEFDGDANWPVRYVRNGDVDDDVVAIENALRVVAA